MMLGAPYTARATAQTNHVTGGYVTDTLAQSSNQSEPGPTPFDALLAVAAEQEAALNELISLLQQEREHIAMFDVTGLLEVTQAKQVHVSRWGTRRVLLKNRALDAWIRLGNRQSAFPSETPDCLRFVGADAGSSSEKLCAAASRLEALLDVSRELHHANQRHATQTKGWLSSTIEQLRGPESGPYGNSIRKITNLRGVA
ncbi:MAG: hypothetical protein ACI81R_000981 [Bradymonadia bacterium]|jgi:hypothetical protein